MSTFRGHNPESTRFHTGKSQPSQKKLRKIPDIVEVQIIEDDDEDNSMHYLMEDTSKQLVLYNSEITHGEQSAVEVTEPIYPSTPLHQGSPKKRYGHDTVLPSIGVYTVQCAHCFKWRVVPTKEKYEELRETISEELFVCARAHEWNRVLSCDDVEDISQDGSRLWAIDKPNIAQPPPGWDREVRIRGEGSSKFADVYYTSPSGKKLRSCVEIGRYLAQNPHYIEQGVNLSQFSFAIPRPLQEDYIKKRTSAARALPEFSEPVEVNPLCWAAPPTRRELLKLGTSASNPVTLDLDQTTSAGQPEMFEAPARHTKKRTMKQVSSPSSESNKRTVKQVSSPSSESNKRTVKQVSSPSSDPKNRTVKQVSSPSSDPKNRTGKQALSPSSKPKKKPVKQAPSPSGEPKKKPVKQAPSPSGEPKKRTPKQAPSPSGEPKKRTPKQAPSPSSEPKKRTPKQAPSPSSEPKKRTPKQAPSPSSEPKKRTPKQAPSQSMDHSATPPSWSHVDQPGGDIEHVLL